MVALKAMLDATWAKLAPGKAVPKLVGPDNGSGDMSSDHLEGILNAAGGSQTMVAATYHKYVHIPVENGFSSSLLLPRRCSR